MLIKHDNKTSRAGWCAPVTRPCVERILSIVLCAVAVLFVDAVDADSVEVRGSASAFVEPDWIRIQLGVSHRPPVAGRSESLARSTTLGSGVGDVPAHSGAGLVVTVTVEAVFELL